MSDLHETCGSLLAAFAGTAALRERLAAESRSLQRSAAAVAAAGRRSRNPRAAEAAAAALRDAAVRCATAAQLVGAAEESGRLFVRRTVGGAYGDGGAVGGDAAAWAGTGDGRGFSSPALAACWQESFMTPAGRAFYVDRDHMRSDARVLRRSPGEYTVDIHGNVQGVYVDGVPLDARQLAELVRADPAWGRRPVRLFSCDTGCGKNSIGAQLARELGVRVTAPDGWASVLTGFRGFPWVEAAEWRRVKGSWRRVKVPGREGRWLTFDP